ncbi:MAG: type II secretion system F family protein [Acidobacteria bacterium]|nr:type II secretion system F family protein [Acidobacteriota bacterium]
MLPRWLDDDEFLEPDPQAGGDEPGATRGPVWWRPGHRVGPKTLAVFSRQFAVLLDAGLPLLQSLEILSVEGQHPGLRQALLQMRAEVEAGSGLAEAMKRRPHVFGDLYVNLVASGEASGALHTVMDRLATHVEKVAKLRNQVRSALTYPVAILTVAAAVVFLILWKVIPVFQHLFDDMGGDLPVLTRIVVGISQFIGAYVLVLVGLAGAAAFAAKRLLGTRRGRMAADRLLLRLPVAGKLMLRIVAGRTCRTLSILLSSGIPILSALSIAADAAGNVVVAGALRTVRREVEQGRPINRSLRRTGIFPAMLCQIVYVGEQTGTLSPMLTRIADFYEEEVDNDVDSMMKLLEPALISILGIVIGIIVISMYLPMYSALTQIG